MARARDAGDRRQETPQRLANESLAQLFLERAARMGHEEAMKRRGVHALNTTVGSFRRVVQGKRFL